MSHLKRNKLQEAKARENYGKMDAIHCSRCGNKVDPRKVVHLELDQRINAYHDFGGVPEEDSQGGFEFGQDCAVIARQEAIEQAEAYGIKLEEQK